MNNSIDIVFDGGPGPDGGRFIEVETGGFSIRFGTWIDRGDGYWVLRFNIDDMKAALAVGKF